MSFCLFSCLFFPFFFVEENRLTKHTHFREIQHKLEKSQKKNAPYGRWTISCITKSSYESASCSLCFINKFALWTISCITESHKNLPLVVYVSLISLPCCQVLCIFLILILIHQLSLSFSFSALPTSTFFLFQPLENLRSFLESATYKTHTKQKYLYMSDLKTFGSDLKSWYKKYSVLKKTSSLIQIFCHR